MKSKKSLISVYNIACRYKRRGKSSSKNEFWALKDVSFNLYDGEVLGVIGRNGAGKSTLLRLMAGIIKPDKGIINIRADRISLLSLQVGFLPHLTGRKNAILSGLMMGMDYDEIVQNMQSILNFSELGDFFDQPVATYSTGMRARLGFSVAFHTDPDVLLIDETLGVGDADFRVKSTAVMKEKIKSDKTVVLVSHSASLIRELCSRAVWIEGGISKAEGSTDDVVSSYEKSLVRKK